MKDAERCRFCRLFALSLLGFSLLLGLLGSYGSYRDYSFVMFTRNTLRALAPAAVGSALLLALLLWAQPLPPARFAADWRRTVVRGAAVSLPGWLLASLLMLSVGALVNAPFGLSLAMAKAALASLTVPGVWLGLVSTAGDVALIVVLAWRFAARVHALRASLPAKLVLVVTVTAPLRATFALLLASLLPS